MGAINLRLPESQHDAVRELAQRENVSVNQLITLVLAEKISALMTEEYLVERGKRGSREKFEAALSQVADINPKNVINFDYERTGSYDESSCECVLRTRL